MENQDHIQVIHLVIVVMEENQEGGESRYSYFSAQRNEFMGRIRCKTGSINNDIGDDRRNVMKELEKELGKIEGESR